MSASDETLEDVLESLRAMSQARNELIAETKTLRQAEEGRHAEALASITEMHRNANASLVEAVEHAHSSMGIAKGYLYDVIGISTQRYGQIKRQIESLSVKKAA